jgi:transcriptional regulator with XRE-family HTH domain
MPAKSIPTNGAAIRAIRQAYGLTRDEVAAHAEITTGALANIENGRDSTPPVLRRIAERLHVPLDAVIRCKLPANFAA